MNALHERCVASWKEQLPDWEIIEWNESNFPLEATIRESRYFRLAYENRIYEFIADYARLVVLHLHGGVYLDTDIELVKSLDPLLAEELFVGMPYPDGNHAWAVDGAVMGSPAQHPFLATALNYYDHEYWSGHAALNELVAQPVVLAYLLRKEIGAIFPRIDPVAKIRIYPQELFHLDKQMFHNEIVTGSVRIPDEAIAINHAFLKSTKATKNQSSWLYNRQALKFRRKVWYYRLLQPLIKLRRKYAQVRTRKNPD